MQLSVQQILSDERKMTDYRLVLNTGPPLSGSTYSTISASYGSPSQCRREQQFRQSFR